MHTFPLTDGSRFGVPLLHEAQSMYSWQRLNLQCRSSSSGVKQVTGVARQSRIRNGVAAALLCPAEQADYRNNGVQIRSPDNLGELGDDLPSLMQGWPRSSSHNDLIGCRRRDCTRNCWYRAVRSFETDKDRRDDETGVSMCVEDRSDASEQKRSVALSGFAGARTM